MKKVVLVLIDGFEEIEALSTVDVLRRGGIDVTTASLNKKSVVTGGHNIPVTADAIFEDLTIDDFDMIVIPGGTEAFDSHEGLKTELRNFAKHDKQLAAICAAPMVLGNLGLLDQKKATCYPGYEKYLKGAEIQHGAAVVEDGNIVTGRGPGLAIPFALKLVEKLAGKEIHDKVAQGLLVASKSESGCCKR